MSLKSSIEWLSLRSLVPHPVIQRDLIRPRVKHLREHFNPDALGIFVVWVYDGFAYIIDGQHRWHAATELGYGDMKVRCDVYRAATLEEMAEKFLTNNDSRFVSAIAKFNIGLVAEKPECIAIRDILAKYDLRVGMAMTDGVVRCIDKLFALYNQDPDLLDDVLAVATNAWGTRSAAVENVILVGLGKVLGHYNGQMDRSAFVQRLAKYKGGPAGLVGNARALSSMKPIGVSRAAAEIMVDSYNAKRRAGALPPL